MTTLDAPSQESPTSVFTAPSSDLAQRSASATISRRVAAEGLGSMSLLAIVVGSGVMGQGLAAGNEALALLANALATGAGLFVLISVLAPISGAQFNPVVTIVSAARGGTSWREVPYFVLAQVFGAIAGVLLAHAMFGAPLVQWSTHARSGAGLLLGEFVATFGLIFVIISAERYKAASGPWVVAAYIVSAYWFTSSTSFANPAVTLARALTDTFAGIRPDGVPGFVLAQTLGAAAAALVASWLVPREALGEPVTGLRPAAGAPYVGGLPRVTSGDARAGRVGHRHVGP